MSFESAPGTDAPPWLADFLLHPPLWFKVGLVLATGVCLALAARRVFRRDGYISRDEQRSMLLILATVEGVALGVVASIEGMGLGYGGDVLVGLVGGFVAVEVLRRGGPWVLGRVADERTQLALGWVALLAVSMVVWNGAAMADVSFPAGLNLGVSGVAVAMLTWTVLQEFGPGETVGDAVRESGE